MRVRIIFNRFVYTKSLCDLDLDSFPSSVVVCEMLYRWVLYKQGVPRDVGIRNDLTQWKKKIDVVVYCI